MAIRQPRAVIIGGSMAGLFAGHFLRRAGWQVDVYERTEGPLSARGAGILTHPELRTILDTLGFETGSGLGVPIEKRVVIGRDDGIVAELPFPQIATSWTRVYSMLATAFPAAHYHAGADFEGFEEDAEGVTVRFSGGRSERADLLVGADGLRSSVRRRLFPNLAPEYAGYVAWRGLLSETDVEAAPFARAGLFAFDLPPGEHMVGYTVAGPEDDLRPGHRRYNFVWYRPYDAATELPAVLTDRDGRLHEFSIPPTMIAPAVVAEMRSHAGRVLSPWFQHVVARTPQPFLQPIYDLAVPSMANGRVALIGDAAFVVRPHVGAGVLKAAADAEALAEALTGAGTAILPALKRFSTVRHAVGTRMIARARWLGCYLRYRFDDDAQRAAAAEVGAPDKVLAETALLDFLYSA